MEADADAGAATAIGAMAAAAMTPIAARTLLTFVDFTLGLSLEDRVITARGNHKLINGRGLREALA
ncbi:hypothetical protein [Streptomyces sp. NPDC056632]|uniref:hypothetical protein n=1 Tax=Streptomyces sp. NPDC056632 TaxID=3345884 RepID=UPI0036BFF423